MKKFVSVCALIFVVFAGQAFGVKSRVNSNLTDQEIAQAPGHVRIFLQKGNDVPIFVGSGLVIARNNKYWLITCEHVLQSKKGEADLIRVVGLNGEVMSLPSGVFQARRKDGDAVAIQVSNCGWAAKVVEPELVTNRASINYYDVIQNVPKLVSRSGLLPKYEKKVLVLQALVVSVEKGHSGTPVFQPVAKSVSVIGLISQKGMIEDTNVAVVIPFWKYLKLIDR